MPHPRPFSAALISACASSAIMLGACAHAPPVGDSAPATPGPDRGVTGLRSGRQLTDTLVYRLLVTSGTDPEVEQEYGSGRIESRVSDRDGTATLIHVWVAKSARGTFNDTLVLDPDGLLPHTESWAVASARRQYEYDGAYVKRTALSPDSSAGTRDHRYEAAVFSFNQVELLARAVPLRRGYKVVVPLYSEGDDAFEADTITVLGPDRSNVWSVRFADRVMIQTYDVDPATRRLVRFDVAGRRPGGRGRWVISRP
jgi:hypothetical protein